MISFVGYLYGLNVLEEGFSAIFTINSRKVVKHTQIIQRALKDCAQKGSPSRRINRILPLHRRPTRIRIRAGIVRLRSAVSAVVRACVGG